MPLRPSAAVLRTFQRPAFLAAALACALGACRNVEATSEALDGRAPVAGEDAPAERVSADERAPGDAGPPQLDDVPALVDRGDTASLEAAHAALGAALVERHLAVARERVAAGEPADALPAFDRALRIAPDRDDVHLERAETLVHHANREREQGGSAMSVQGGYEDARAAYARAGRSSRALLGLSHVSWLLGNGADAHRHAEQGARRLQAARAARGKPDAASFGADDLASAPFASVEQIRAEGAALAHAQAVQANTSGSALQRLEQSAQEALDAWLGAAPENPRAWLAEVDFALWRLAPEDALTTLLAGLDALADDPQLLARLADVATRARGQGGAADVLAERADRDGAPLDLRWAAAEARFHAGLDQLPSRGEQAASYPEQLAEFEDAERRFSALERDLPEGDARKAQALGWRVVARAGQGWVRYAEHDYDAAERLFLSTRELANDGLAWKWEPRLRSSLVGLQLVAERLRESREIERAAELLWTCHEAQPDDALLASNAGLYLRDLAVARQDVGSGLCALAHGRLDDADSDRLRRAGGLSADGSEDRSAKAVAAANRWTEHAVADMERAFTAYRSALAVSPDDPWILRDAALVLVYYLHRDFDQAIAWLERAIEVAEGQAAAEDPATQGPGSITEVWGDAHQNLGVYHALHTDDVEAAARHFRRAVEIGPAPAITRPDLRRALERYEAGDATALGEIDGARSFGRTCEELPE